jgi:hypothetical protein
VGVNPAACTPHHTFTGAAPPGASPVFRRFISRKKKDTFQHLDQMLKGVFLLGTDQLQPGPGTSNGYCKLHLLHTLYSVLK